MSNVQNILSQFAGLSPAEQQKITKTIGNFNSTMTDFGAAIASAASSAGTLSDRFDVLKDGIQSAIGFSDQQMESLGAGASMMAAYAIQAEEAMISLGGLNKEQVELVKRQKSAAESFNATTGFAGQYNEMIMNAAFANRDLGLSGGEISGVFSNLTTIFTDFTKDGVSPSEGALVEAAMALEAVGISSATSGESFQILRKGFGQTDAEIVRTTLGLENFAEELGVSSDAIFTTFNQQMPVLAMFGNRAEQVFRQSAAAAKATGIEFSKQMSLFDLTDTFESSAKATGKLNALLGGPFLNTVELTMAETPVERMQLLSQAFQDAGVSVESLGRRQIQAFVAATPGIENATDLIKLQKGGFEDLIDTTDAVAKSRSELADEAATRRSFEDNQKIALEVAKGIDGIAQRFDTINRKGFTPLIESAETARDKVGSALEPLLDTLSDKLSALGGELGLEGGNLERISQAAIAAREGTLAQSTGRQGQNVIRLQVFLDGKEMRNAIVAPLDQ